MDLIILFGSYLLWFPLQILTIAAILRVGVRRYPLIFSYLVIGFLIAVTQMPAALAYYFSGRRQQSEFFRFIHSIADGIIYVLILAIVISFIYRASAPLAARSLLRVALLAGSLIFMAVSFWSHYDSRVLIGMWMTPWTRDLNVCAAILDLALWMLLLIPRKKEHYLLLLAGGMGIMFAGEAIGAAVQSIAIRYRSHDLLMFGHVLMVFTDAAFLYVWWQAFRKEAAARAALTATNHR
jgi:hypothetical protein